MLNAMINYWKKHPDRRVKFTLVAPLFPLILICKGIGTVGYQLDKWAEEWVEGEKPYEIVVRM